MQAEQKKLLDTVKGICTIHVITEKSRKNEKI